MPKPRLPKEPVPFPATVQPTAAELGMVRETWKHLAADRLLGGEALLWRDVEPPRFALRRRPNNTFKINDDDWCKIEELIGQKDSTENYSGSRLFDVVLDLPLTMRGRLTEKLCDYITDLDAAVDIPNMRKSLEEQAVKLLKVEELFLGLTTEPSDFLSNVFTQNKNFVRTPKLRVDDKTRDDLETLWTYGVGPRALLLFVCAYRKNVERALALLSGTKPTGWERRELGRQLALYWRDVTASRPTSGRSADTSEQTGRFSAFFELVVKQLPPGFEWKKSQIRTEIRIAVDSMKKQMGE